MSCQIPTSTLEDALFQAYRTDFQKYKNLSAVIQSVIDQQIAPEAKIHAIWFYSGFVNSAAFTVEELQTPEWNAGVYSSIHEYLKPFLTGEKEFDYGNIMEGVKDLFPKALVPGATLFELEKLKKRNGRLGEQGATAEGIRDLLKFLGINLEGVDTTSIKAMAEFLKANPSERQKVLDFVKKEPVQITKFPEDYYELQDGNHRAVILYYSGVEQVPAIIKDLSGEKPVSTEPYSGPFAGESPVEIETGNEQTLEERIESDIADIPVISDSNIAQYVNDLVQMILSNKASLDAYTAGSEMSMLLNYLNQVKVALSARSDSPGRITMIDMVESIIKSEASSLDEGAKYEDLSNAQGITMDAGERIFEYRRADGTKFEALYKSGRGESRVFTYYAPGSEVHGQVIDSRPGDQKVEIYKKDNIARIDKQNGSLRITESELLTGLVLGDQSELNAEGKLVRDQMAAEMTSDRRFINQIRITASTANSEFNLNRLNRIREQFPDIARILETNELPAQREMLKKGEGPILTFVRRTSGFTVTISNWQGSKSFELSPLSDLAFVYSDNRVEELDVNNSEHMDRIKDMLQVRDNREFNLSIEDVQRYRARTFSEIENSVQKFKDAVNTYKAFEFEVQKAMAESGITGNLDIRNIFTKYYDISNSIQRVGFIVGKNEPEMPLGDFIDANEGRLTVKMQAFDENGNPTSGIREALVPIVLRKTRGQWEVMNTLPENEKLINDSGTKSYGTVEAYLMDNGINLMEYAKNFNNHQALYIGFRQVNDILTPYAKPLVYRQNVNTPADMVDMALTLRSAFSKARIEEGNKEMLNLNEKGWGFDVFDRKGDGIRVEFVILDQKKDKKTFGIKFEMLSGQGRNQERIDRFNKYAEKNMNIVLSENILNEMFDAVDKLMQSKNVSITSDMNIESVSRKGFEVGSTTPITNPLMQNLFEAYSKFVDDVKMKFNDVVNNYEIALDLGRVSPGLLTDNFVNYGLFDGNVLKIKKRGVKQDFRTNFFTVKTNDVSEITISRRNTAKKIVVPAKKPKGPAKGINYDSASPVEEIDTEKEPVDPGTIDRVEIDLTNFDPNALDSDSKIGFSLVDTVEDFITLSDEEFASEIKTIRDLMPERFTFTRRAFEDMNVDGHALGYIEDMMIHLNDTLKAKGVAYHEGFHGVFRKLLSSAQQAFYLKKAGEILGDYKTDDKGKYIEVGGKRVYASEFRKARRYGHLTDEQVKNLIYEEYLADSFANFMETNKVPRTWMEKLFAYLKKLLNMFKKGGRIDNLFYDISLGKYRNAPIREGMNDVTKVYSMDYKGIPYLAFKSSMQIGFDNQTIPSFIVSQVRDMMIYRMAEAKMENPELRFNQLYNIARTKVLENYTIDNLVAKNPSAEQSIRDDYGFHYSSARWLLGALQDGETFTYLNYTDRKELDNKVIDKSNKVQTQIAEFNATKFRNHVIEEFSEVYKGSTMSEDVDDMEYEMQQEEDEQESGNQFADVGFANKAPYEGSAYFRKLFAYIPYEYIDHKNGITYTKMVNSKLIFSTIRKLTANLDKSQIVPAILDEMSRLDSEIRNYYENVESLLGEMQAGVPDDIAQMIDLRDSLYGVYNTLAETVGITPAGYASKNQHILSMFQDVFNTVDARLLQVQLETTLAKDEETGKLKEEGQVYRADDIVISSDMHKIRTDMTDRLATMALDKTEVESSIAVLKRINTIFSDKRNITEQFFTQDGLFNDAAFDSFINQVYAAISKFNLNIPRQLIYTSLGFITYQKGGNNLGMFVEGSKLRSTLRLNKPLLKNIGELSPEFWGVRLPRLVEINALRTEKERKNIAIAGIGLDVESRNFVNKYVNSAGEFLIKYNPTIGGSMTRDANGNLVHKYVKPTPAYMTVMKLQSVVDPVTGEVDVQEGLRVLADEYLDGHIEFLLDNLMLNHPKNPEISKDFMRELEVSAFAGFSQSFSVFSNRKEGDTSTFKSIDEKAYMMSMFGLFERRRDVKYSKDPNRSFTLFKRILTQYEATSTSIVVDGIFKPYYKDGKVNKDNRTGISMYVTDLMHVLRQEYEMIRRNFKNDREGKDVKRYKGYNMNPGDRGYTFNILADMFGITEGDDTLVDPNVLHNRKALIQLAEQDKSFESIVADAEMKAALVEMIEQYASNQYKRFNDYLDQIGISEVHAPKTGSFEEFKGNFFYNNWINSIFVNQLFDGPIAVGISNFANYFKRQKAGAAAGSNMYSPNRSMYGNVKKYRSSVVRDFVMYLDNNDLTKPLSLVPYDSPGNIKVLPFDGQSINTIDRRIRIADANGNLDTESLQIMNRMRYETRSSREYRDGIQKLRDRGIVFNSIKSVTAGFQYIKQSEHTLIRKDLSMLAGGIEYDTAMVELENLYSQADYYAMEIEATGDRLDPETGKTLSLLYKETITKAHSYFKPVIPGELGGFLHNLLNSMELHRIEQVYDTNASKRATVAPLDFDMAESAGQGVYLDLEQSLDEIPNELTYNQIETSKIAKKVTSGIQQKLLLISQLDPSDPLYKELKDDINTYQNGLADAVSSQTKRMMRLFNTSDKNIIAKLYGSVAAGLREQGSDATLLQYFELNTKGEPINPPSMQVLSNILTYYYFSMFNKNIFDKKVEGRKYYHISPLLAPVIEMDGKIVKRSEYRKNPRKYQNAKSRYLTMTSEEVEVKNPYTGKMEKITKYTAEVVVPKELQKFKQEFVEKYLTEFFATRIPTEDKRSMFVAKIVDYMDEAYGNSIAVPQQIHLMAGSDFDIDALYAYLKAHYVAADGTMILYGNYEHYKTTYGMSEKEAKFMEYLTSISKDEIIGDMVKEEMRKIKNQTDYRKEQAYNFGELFGGKIQEYFSKNASVLEESENIDNEEKIDTFKRLIATFNVLQRLDDSDLPTTPDGLMTYIHKTKSNPVVEITLNNILEAKNRILSNKNVYDRFFANTGMRADAAVERYKNLVERKGLTEKDIYNKQNIYTPTALAVARALNSESKDSLGIAASFNKGLSMLTTIGATFQGNITNAFYTETINDKGKSVLEKVNTDRIVEDSVQRIGALIGLFADAPKTPYPGPLHLNSLTTPVLSAMLASGLPQNAAIMFQSIPLIKNLVNKYNRDYSSAYSSTQTKKRMSFNKFLSNEIKAILEDKNLQRELDLHKIGNLYDDTSYKIIYNDDKITKDDPKDVANNTVPLSNYGFTIVDRKGVELSRSLQDAIMLSNYETYARLASELSFGVTVLTDPLKALKPDFDRFDKLIATYESAIQGNMKFLTKDSMKNLFLTYPVLRQNYEALKYMSDVSRMMFMERTSLMKGFVSLFDTVWGYDKKDIRKDLSAFIGMQLQRHAVETSPVGVLPQIYKEMLDPENFLSGQVIADYHELRIKYPNNAFLESLKVVQVGNKTKGYRVLEMATSRLGVSGREAAFADLKFLLEGDPVTKEKAFRIAYHGMIKSGGQRMIGGYYDILPEVLSRPMATELWKLQSKLVKLDRFVLKNFKKIDNEDGTQSMPEEAKATYKKMVNEILSGSFGDKKLSDLITEAISKIISTRIESNPDSFFVKTINPSKLGIERSQLVSFFQDITPMNAQYIIEEYQKGDSTAIRVPRVKGGIASTLREGNFDLFTPDMNGNLLIDTSKLEGMEQEIKDDYANMLGAAGIYGSVERGYMFPLFNMNSRKQMMVLSKIDGESIGDSFVSTLAENNFGNSNGIMNLRGTTAEYEVVEGQGTSKISPMGFTKKEGVQIRNMILGSAQSTSLEKIPDLPARMVVKYNKNRMYEILKSPQSYGKYSEKTFKRLDGSTITTGKRMNRYQFVDGQLLKSPDAGKITELVKPERYDMFADALGYDSWESLTKSPAFGDFMNGQSYIFVYELINGDATSVTSDPTINRPDDITIEDMDDQIEDEINNCNKPK